MRLNNYLAVRVLSTRCADLVPGEPAAVPEGVPGGAPGAPADGHVVLNAAVGSGPAGDGARVHALQIRKGSIMSFKVRMKMH